jgi:hypothetical protein
MSTANETPEPVPAYAAVRVADPRPDETEEWRPAIPGRLYLSSLDRARSEATGGPPETYTTDGGAQGVLVPQRGVVPLAVLHREAFGFPPDPSTLT